MNFSRRTFCIITSAALAGCGQSQKREQESTALLQAYSDDIFKLIDPKSDLQVLGEGYGWAEGPAWDKNNNCLYFTDVPGNKAYKWSESKGVETFLTPSGSSVTDGFREPGANGLLYTDDGILLCNHGKRSVEMLDPLTLQRTNVANNYNGKRFNSPNDIIQNQNKEVFFTDPPYGLEGLNDSPLKELEFNGVYKADTSGNVTALIKDMTFPNGVALSPDGQILYISQSDPEAAHLYALDLSETRATKRLLVDFTPYMDNEHPGLPDGMAIDQNGNIFVTGPGGVFVIRPDGKVLGRILTGKASANCTFGKNGQTLFITNHDRLISVPTKTRALNWDA